MAWIEVHDTLPDHWKADELADDLSISLPLTIGHLVCLWLKAIRFKPGGKLVGVSKVTIAKWAQWGGNADEFVDALVRHGWVDNLGGRGKTLGIHDWTVYTRSFQKAIADRDRKRRARGRGKSEDSPRTGAVDQTGPDQTGTEQTRPDPPPGGALKSGSVAAQIASNWRAMNRNTMSQAAVTDRVQNYLDQGMNAEVALARSMDPKLGLGKPWDVFEPIVPQNGEDRAETMAEYRKRRDVKKEVDEKF
ncbi:MAG: hypothetical protein ACYSWU_00880 [Planctomycetota bacterium]|jgi:hypothetical protein